MYFCSSLCECVYKGYEPKSTILTARNIANQVWEFLLGPVLLPEQRLGLKIEVHHYMPKQKAFPTSTHKETPVTADRKVDFPFIESKKRSKKFFFSPFTDFMGVREKCTGVNQK